MSLQDPEGRRVRIGRRTPGGAAEGGRWSQWLGNETRGFRQPAGTISARQKSRLGKQVKSAGNDYVSGQTYASEGFKAGRRRGSRHKHWDQNGARSKSACARNHETSRRILFLDKQIRPVLNEGTEYVGGEANRDSTSGCPPEEATRGGRGNSTREGVYQHEATAVPSLRAAGEALASSG